MSAMARIGRSRVYFAKVSQQNTATSGSPCLTRVDKGAVNVELCCVRLGIASEGDGTSRRYGRRRQSWFRQTGFHKSTGQSPSHRPGGDVSILAVRLLVIVTLMTTAIRLNDNILTSILL